MVFITRYLDLATNYVSVYNSVMKVIFIVSSIATCYLIFFKFRATYDSNHDAFRAEFLVIPTAGLALLVNHEFSVMEVCQCVYLVCLPALPPSPSPLDPHSHPSSSTSRYCGPSPSTWSQWPSCLSCT